MCLGGLQQPLHQHGAFARHARARDDEVEAGRLGAAPRGPIDVRVDAHRPRLPQLPAGAQPLDDRHAVEAGAPEVDDQHRGPVRVGLVGRAGQARLVTRCAETAEDVRTEQEVVEEGDDEGHRYCARMRRNSWRTDSGRPHICVVSTRPVRTSRKASSPGMPWSSRSLSVPWTAGAAAAWPNWWATMIRQCQSWWEYG